MLAALEHGLVDDILDCEPQYVIYQGIVDHVRQSANRALADNTGQKYLMVENDTPTYFGQLGTPPRPRRRSEILRALLDLRVRERDIDLFVGIVDASRTWVEERYPAAEFDVLFWDERESSHSAKMLSRLRTKGVDLHLVSDILPGLHEEPWKFTLSPLDRHPSPTVHRRIAEYVSGRIIGGQ